MWYFVENEASVGPATEQDMVDHIRSGRVTSSTPVWTEGAVGWEQAKTVAAFEELFRRTPPPLPGVATEPAFASTSTDEEPREPFRPAQPGIFVEGSPWSRFTARLIDNVIWTIPAIFLILFIVAITRSQTLVKLLDNQFAVVLMIMPLIGLLNALAMTVFGNTIGKTLMGVVVAADDGSKEGFLFYLIRELKVLIIGMGVGIPIVALFTQIYQHGQVKNKGQASYDRGVARVEVYFTSNVRVGIVLTVSFLATAFFNSPGAESLGIALGKLAYNLVHTFAN